MRILARARLIVVGAALLWLAGSTPWQANARLNAQAAPQPLPRRPAPSKLGTSGLPFDDDTSRGGRQREQPCRLVAAHELTGLESEGRS
jgi:hypothetical protein